MSAVLKPDKPIIQTIGLRNIKVDHTIQSRVAMSVDDIHDFSELLLADPPAVFPPIDVFFDKVDYWLADGFHRYTSHQKVGLKNILCNVHEGSRIDAVVFSAGANQRFSIKRTPADIHKAIVMLLNMKEWFDLSGLQIARHVGCAPMTVSSVREEFCRENDRKLPATFRAANGRDQPSIKISRGTDPAQSTVTDRYSLEWTYIRHLFTSRFGFQAVLATGMGEVYPGIRAMWRERGKVLMTPCDFAGSDSLPTAVGRIMLADEMRPSKRSLVLCYPDDGPAETMALATKLGIEFISPEDLIAEIKGGKA